MRKQQLQSDFSRQGYKSFSLFPEAGVIAIKDKREWPSSREELGTSWVVTVCIDSIAAARLSMIQQEIELAQVSLKQKNKFGVKYDIYFYRFMATSIKEHIVKVISSLTCPTCATDAFTRRGLIDHLRTHITIHDKLRECSGRTTSIN